MTANRINGLRLGKIILGLSGILVLSGCKTTSETSENMVLNDERTKSTIEQSIIEGDWSLGVSLIRHSRKNSYDELMPWLKDRAHTFPPVYLYAMADRMFKRDKNGALNWYIAARVRHTYDLLRCTQAGAIQRLDVFADRFDKTVFKFAAKNPKIAYELALEGLAWDVNNPLHRTSPAKECLVAKADFRERSWRSKRDYRSFDSVFYSGLTPLTYPSNLIKPSWTHPELLDLARVKTKRFIDDLKFSNANRKARLTKDDEFSRKNSARSGQSKPWRLNRGNSKIQSWKPFTD